MGLDPEDDTYEEGEECEVCVDVLFDDVTPKFVYAQVEDIVLCPPRTTPNPNGTFLLEQDTPCNWRLLTGGLFYSWGLQADTSSFTIFAAGLSFFSSVADESCIDEFSNDNEDCEIFPIIATGGTVKLFWGPDIPPPC